MSFQFDKRATPVGRNQIQTSAVTPWQQQSVSEVHKLILYNAAGGDGEDISGNISLPEV